MKNYWDSNIEALKIKYSELYNRLINYSPENIGEIISTATLPTLLFNNPGLNYNYLYEPDDTIGHIKSYLPILKNENNLSQTICVFTGMGLGYTQLITFEQRSDIFRLMILEPSIDMFYFALKYVDLLPLILSDKVFLQIGEIDWDIFFKIITQKNIETDFLFSDYQPLFDWKPELYSNTKQMARTFAERAIAGLGVLTQFGEQLFKNRIINLRLLRESSPVDVLKGAFKGKPAILVSAGPSLGKSFEMLKKAVGRCIIIALDSAVVPLLNNGIKPDFVTTLDYQDINSEKLSPDIIKQQDFYLVANITSSHLTAKRLKLKHLFFSFQENDAQDWILDGMGATHRMPPVGSVAMLSLSFAQMTQANPIILVGHDFALTSTDIDHVEGSVLAGGHYFTLDKLTVQGVDGKPVLTNNTFLEFKINFEHILKNYDLNYINSTAVGAHIEGTSTQSLESVIEKYLISEISPVNIVNECLKNSHKKNTHQFIVAANKVLYDANNTLTEIKKILNSTVKITTIINNKAHNKAHKLNYVKEFSELPSDIQTAKQKIKKLYSNYKPFFPMEELSAKRIMEANSVSMEANTVDTESNGVNTESNGVNTESNGVNTELKGVNFKENKSNQSISSVYINKLFNDNSTLDLQMRAHKYGLEEFIKLVKEIVIFLEKEDALLQALFPKKTVKNPMNERQLLIKNSMREKQFFDLIELYLKSETFIKSENVLYQFIELFPNSSLISKSEMLMGVTAAQRLDFDAAFKFWGNSEKKEPALKNEIIEYRKQLADYWLFWGFIGVWVGHTIVDRIIQRALILWDDPTFFTNVKDGHWDECSAYLINCVDNKNIENGGVFLSLSTTLKSLIKTPNFKDVIRAFETKWYYWKTVLFFEKKEIKEALSCIESALTDQSDNADWLGLAAKINLQSGDYNKAIEHLIKAVQLDSKQAVLWEEIGDTLFVQQDYTSAAIAYEKCFLAMPNKIDVLRKFGDCYLKNNHFEAAKTAYIAVLQKEPLNGIAKHNLMRIENMER